MMAQRIPRVPVREQDPKVRAHNFDEVCYGYNLEEATTEALRCLHCKNPRCVQACPVSVKIPEFIAKVAAGDIKAAAAVIAEDSSLPAVCGRVCPQESQCEGSCILGVKGEPVAIGKLERFVADHTATECADTSTGSVSAPVAGQSAPVTEPTSSVAEPTSPVTERTSAVTAPVTEPAEVTGGAKVAIIGSGPAGLACASDLAKKGYNVTIFEALHKAGGVLEYGIPEFRLPKDTVL